MIKYNQAILVLLFDCVETVCADVQEVTDKIIAKASLTIPALPVVKGLELSVSDVVAAVQQSQRGEHRYRDVIRKTMAAGCVGYFVQITGCRLI